eukprot:1143013-Pelagomonas_calceolata.AAC.5
MTWAHRRASRRTDFRMSSPAGKGFSTRQCCSRRNDIGAQARIKVCRLLYIKVCWEGFQHKAALFLKKRHRHTGTHQGLQGGQHKRQGTGVHQGAQALVVKVSQNAGKKTLSGPAMRSKGQASAVPSVYAWLRRVRVLLALNSCADEDAACAFAWLCM